MKLVFVWFPLHTHSIKKSFLLAITLLYGQLLPPAYFCPHPVLLIPSSILSELQTSFLPSRPMLSISVWLSQSSCWANPLSLYSASWMFSIPSPQYLWLLPFTTGPTTRIILLIVKQLLSLSWGNSCLLAFLLHKFTKSLRALSKLSYLSLWVQNPARFMESSVRQMLRRCLSGWLGCFSDCCTASFAHEVSHVSPVGSTYILVTSSPWNISYVCFLLFLPSPACNTSV